MQDKFSNLTDADWTGLGGTVIGGVTSYFGSQENRKASEASADALKQKSKTDLEIAKILQQTELAKLSAVQPAKAGNSTLYIALGIGGVLVLGVVIFAVTRSKKG